jgi:GTPase
MEEDLKDITTNVDNLKIDETPPKQSIISSLKTNIESEDYIKEIRVAVIGNVDSGKSTLVGCLTKNIKDDGRGFARQYVFNYQHESETGRTSSIAEEILGYKNHKSVDLGRINEKKILPGKKSLINLTQSSLYWICADMKST